ncbi:Nn.00g011420.m01.CDS01 [Neocucurbitaria sp. VM-36]
MYSPDPRQDRDYRSANDEQYNNDERSYYNGPDAGVAAPRGRDDYSKSRGFEVAPYQAPPQRDYEQGRDYGDYGDRRGRPSHQRRGSSWSPPRSKKHDHDSHTPRASSRSKDKQHRIMATVGGAIVGGFAGNQARKGKKYDTVATIVGAIVGGVGAREASELWEDRRRKKDEKDGEWEEEFGKDDRGNDRGSDRRRSDRGDRGDRGDRDDRDDRRRY